MLLKPFEDTIWSWVPKGPKTTNENTALLRVVTENPNPPFAEEVSFQNTYRVLEKEQKYNQESRQGLKPRMTVMAKPISKLLHHRH
jgi:hypothetical protein